MEICSLLAMDRTSPKNIAFIGDAMIDEWILGSLQESQDGCQKFVMNKKMILPGGTGNAALQLLHWPSSSTFVAPTCYGTLSNWDQWVTVEKADLAPRGYKMPVKTRYVDKATRRIVFRHDNECGYELDDEMMFRVRAMTLKILQESSFHAVVLSDYTKGFLGPSFIRDVISVCTHRQIPVIADPKLPPLHYAGSYLKCNADYYNAHGVCVNYGRHFRGIIVTDGPRPPFGVSMDAFLVDKPRTDVHCLNHVGAGDCFSAHFALAIAHGFAPYEAAAFAHAAGRVYVQHWPSRPPWPHEIFKDLDPVRGKVLSGFPSALRQSTTGRIVFTNGVFRLPHAGHAWLLDWARSQGDMLVVGINDDESAAMLRPGEFVLPLSERLEILCNHQSVDWIIPFTESTPNAIIASLKPDVLVKGSEYANTRIPGDDLVGKIMFASPSPYTHHSTHLIEAVAKHGE